MARTRNAPSRPQATPEARTTRRALREKTNLVQLPKSAAGKKDTGKKQIENRATRQVRGKLAEIDGLGTKSSNNVKVAATREQSQKDSLEPNHGDGSVRANRRCGRTKGKVLSEQDHDEILQGLRDRMEGEASAQKRRSKSNVGRMTSPVSSMSQEKHPQIVRTEQPTSIAVQRSHSSISLSPEPARPNSLKRKRGSPEPSLPPNAPHQTPLVDTSTLALKHFKRRPRQPSMLHVVQQRIASAQQSMISVRPDESLGDLDLGNLDDTFDDEDDFTPDAEGTPLHTASGRGTVFASGGTMNAKSFHSAKRAKRRSSSLLAGDEDISNDRPTSGARVVTQLTNKTGARALKQLDSNSVIVVRSSASPSSSSLSSRGLSELAGDLVIPSTEEAQNREQVNTRIDLGDDDAVSTGTMAEPVGSSSPARGSPSTAPNDFFADPMTQASPVIKKTTRQRKPAKPMSTATLQSLLPKRRQAQRQGSRNKEYDMTSETESDEADGADSEDEATRNRRRRRAGRTTTPKSRKLTTPMKSASMKKTAALASSTLKRSAQKSIAKSSSAKKKTYGRLSASNKENLLDDTFEEADESTVPDVSLSMLEAAQSKELEDARLKFADVDAWDMEFESIADEHRDSSQSWR